jgi:hypothetical protein
VAEHAGYILVELNRGCRNWLLWSWNAAVDGILREIASPVNEFRALLIFCGG